MHKKLICKNNQKKQNKVFFMIKKTHTANNTLIDNRLQNVKKNLNDKKKNTNTKKISLQ